MTRLVKVYLGVRRQFTLLFMAVSIALFIVAFALFFMPEVFVDPTDKYRLVFGLVLLGLIGLYGSYTAKSVEREYMVYSELGDKTECSRSKLVLPVDSVEEVSVSIYRTLYRGKYKTSIKYGDRRKVSREIDLGENKPYLFIGRVSSIRRKVFCDVITSFLYDGIAYLFRYKDLEFLLIPFYKVYPDLEDKTLKVSHNKDYCEAHLSLDRTRVLAKIYYRRKSSRRVKLVILKNEKLYTVFDTELCSLDREGECIIELPELETPHILLLVNDPKFINNTEIPIKEFSYIGRLYDNTLILGYKDLSIRLVLDLPHKKDVYSETRLKTKTI